MPEWLKGTVCKIVAEATQVRILPRPSEKKDYKEEGEPWTKQRLDPPSRLQYSRWRDTLGKPGLRGAVVAHVLGKNGVMGSSPIGGSIFSQG